MTPADYVAIIAILAVLGGAVAYIVKAKRNGQKCIGCPYSSSCGKHSCSCNTEPDDNADS